MGESQKRLFQFSLGGIFALVTTFAIVTNFAMVDATKGAASMGRLMVASVFLVGAASYFAIRIKGKPGFWPLVAFALWVVVGWGTIIPLCVSSVLLGSLLSQILGSAS